MLCTLVFSQLSPFRSSDHTERFSVNPVLFHIIFYLIISGIFFSCPKYLTNFTTNTLSPDWAALLMQSWWSMCSMNIAINVAPGPTPMMLLRCHSFATSCRVTIDLFNSRNGVKRAVMAKWVTYKSLQLWRPGSVTGLEHIWMFTY